MRIIILIFCVTQLCSCSGQQQTNANSAISEWQLDPASPSKDSLDAWCSIESESLVRVQKNDTLNCDMYYLTGNPYSGWSCSILSNNIHRYIYEQYENGVMIRRIGYYDNGNIDADFRMKNCKNYGPSRMWRYEGGMYIDEFYSEPGVPNGIHRRWHDNGILAREAQYENGILLTEKEFDRNGKLITKK